MTVRKTTPRMSSSVRNRKGFPPGHSRIVGSPGYAEASPCSRVTARQYVNSGSPVIASIFSRNPRAHLGIQWQVGAVRTGLAAQVYTYPGAGHFYTDPCLADYHAASADQTWQRVTAFLAAL